MHFLKRPFLITRRYFGGCLMNRIAVPRNIKNISRTFTYKYTQCIKITRFAKSTTYLHFLLNVVIVLCVILLCWVLPKFWCGKFCVLHDSFFKKMGQPRPLFIYFRHFQTQITIVQQINVKNVHLVYVAGIRTHNIWNMSLLPYPLDQGSLPNYYEFAQNKMTKEL